MQIAIAANENHLKTFVDPHFGRCIWYCIYDTETHQSSFIENPVHKHLENAGREAADFLIDKGVGFVIAGRFGSKVVEVFRQNNIQMIIPETQQTLQKIINHIK
jgi:predicted Fe-Mo cluster-binding NifX family protein